MQKQDLIQLVEERVAEGSLTLQELQAAFQRGSERSKFHSRMSQNSTGNVLAFLGGAIILIGMVILVSGAWEGMGHLARISSTLGLSALFYGLGFSIRSSKEYEVLCQICFAISGLLLPLAILTLTNALEITMSAGLHVLAALVCLLVFTASLFLLRKAVFVLLSLLAASWLTVALTGYTASSGTAFVSDLDWYVLAALGVSYLLVARQLVLMHAYDILVPWIYGVGTAMLLGFLLPLTGWSVGEGVVLDILYPLVAISLTLLSTRVHSLAMLIISAFFLMVFIIKFTAIYFSDTVGWPFALILIGALLVGLGYYVVYLNKRYLARVGS